MSMFLHTFMYENLIITTKHSLLRCLMKHKTEKYILVLPVGRRVERYTIFIEKYVKGIDHICIYP